MPRSDQRLLYLCLPCDVTAPARARRALRDLAELAELHEDVALIVSELVTNAVVHSGGSAHDSIFVALTRDDHRVRIDVDDPGYSRGVPTPRAVGHPSNSSGLRLVQRAATRWGTQGAPRRRVWAELAM